MVPTSDIDRLAGLNAVVSSSTGHSDCCSRVRRHLHFQVEAIPVCSNGVFVRLEIPADADFAVPADILRVRRSDVAAGDGRDVDTLPARLRG